MSYLCLRMHVGVINPLLVTECARYVWNLPPTSYQRHKAVVNNSRPTKLFSQEIGSTAQQPPKASDDEKHSRKGVKTVDFFSNGLPSRAHNYEGKRPSCMELN
ncbi:hypothetical protein, unlikely [Trypanosoma brucei gambiense DAL972]|uniref:Uncharacterized protein n=1 Tax=Trypanosoma brucei gambiense (strain MHOM/CI/86/DAL972) TaxID=679716 RepID=C9ZZT4_TRYB9|nr:hypothetical protein, unlikely [Trypanosoma brucei gambiense DAL972]CBH16492.1 hypothetical protein, unlikely [Trypanosoma brucei gambiense DAL972]|eukprot:XP_011778756.1 hypothetical protein, unlikely [Trypanosoma brucei gambiense DAL972]